MSKKDKGFFGDHTDMYTDDHCADVSQGGKVGKVKTKKLDFANLKPDFGDHVDYILDDINTMLKAKNKAYGNSALEPVKIFSKISAMEQLQVRLDDKLSRIAKGSEYPGDDTIDDIIGYLVLLKIQRSNQKDEEQRLRNSNA